MAERGPWSPATSQLAAARISSSVASFDSPRDVRIDEHCQQLTECLLPADVISQRNMGLDAVTVSPAFLTLDDVASCGEVADNAKSAALGDADGRRDIAQADSGIVGDADVTLFWNSIASLGTLEYSHKYRSESLSPDWA